MKKRAFFYILGELEKYHDSICKLVKNFYQKKSKIILISSDENLIMTIDQLLWTFEQISFIPHTTVKNYDKSTPIFLYNESDKSINFDINQFDTLFNLNDSISKNYLNYKTIIEFVLPDENKKIYSRKKYQLYKSNGFDVTHEKIS